MGPLAKFATVHWLRFPQVVHPEQLSFPAAPRGCMSLKIGPDGPVGPNGYRLPSAVWCALALYDERDSAEAGLAACERFLPACDSAVEHWHALLLPVAHRGICNHFDRDKPSWLLEASTADPGGPLFVVTTAGYVMGPGLDVARVIDFRQNVDKVHDSLQQVEGRVASQVFTPHTVGDDGVTMSLWRSDAAMVDAMYKPGVHRSVMERHKRAKMADRTSFSRFRVLATRGSWAGRDPLELAL